MSGQDVQIHPVGRCPFGFELPVEILHLQIGIPGNLLDGNVIQMLSLQQMIERLPQLFLWIHTLHLLYCNNCAQ